MDTDPARLAAVSDRRAALTALTRKYGETVDEVLAWAEQRPRGCSSSTTPTSGSRSCAPSRTRCAEPGAPAGRLSAARTEAAERLGRRVTAELTLLAMPHARLEVAVRRA